MMITKWKFTALLLFSIAVLMLFSFKKQHVQQPNIIFLLADDLRYNSIGCMGNTIVQTPNIDQLAAQGTLFKNSYVTTAICCVSRASIFTGQYSNRHGIHDFTTDFKDSALKTNFPELLKANGYYTGFIGKYGVGVHLPSADYNFWKGFGEQGVYFYKDENGKPIHSSDLMGNQALEFLNNRDESKPFCLQVSFKAPHVQDGNPIHNGYIYSPKYENLYSNIAIPPLLNGADKFYYQFSKEFRTNSKGIENEARVRWGLRFSTPEKYQESVKSYYRLITGMDDVVKRIVDDLKKKGLDKNTIIIFSSDNGYSLGDHGLEGKWFGQDVSLRTINIVYDGRFPQKQVVSSEIALNVDLAPTILDYAGIKIPAKMQGQSLRPLVEGKKTLWRKDFYYNHLLETEGPASKVYIPKSEGLISVAYNYNRYFKGKDPDQYFFEELYDNKADPLEINNLAQDLKQDAFKQKLIKRMKKLRYQ